LTVRRAPRSWNGIPAWSYDSRRSACVEIDGVGDPIGRHLKRLADDFGPGLRKCRAGK
jgi:hypothetical protein